jgi:peptidoglycan-associated lipoprotein
MMTTTRSKILMAACALGVAACGSTPEGAQTGAPVEDRTSTPRPSTSTTTAANTNAQPSTNVNPVPLGPSTVAPTATPGRGDPALRDPKSLLSQRSIFFDYDGFIVSGDYKALIEAHARYLVANREARMRIEGNTDERGSREYNLALGQRRADAVRRAMALLGVNETQIETVSFGEEKPRAGGTSEESWRENRRADIVYAGE